MRSRRLEATFGALLADVRAENVHALVAGAVPEDFDLDFKIQMYGTSDAEKRDLASDVAAMANLAGGVILIGVEENEHAQAIAAPGVPMSDEVDRRILQVVSGISPVPSVAVRRVPVGDDPAHGFVMILVPRSLAAPHAVTVNGTSLRFPIRHGTTTRFMQAPEVATAFRQRALAQNEQPDRAAVVEREADARLAEDVWVQVSLVPELAGDLKIDSAALRACEAEHSGNTPTVFSPIRRQCNARAGHRRIVASSDMYRGEPFTSDLMELHKDGSGSWSHSLWNLANGRREDGEEPATYLFSDESLTEAGLSGAAVLAGHARDRAGASGTALLRVRLINKTPLPLSIGHTRRHGWGEAIPGSFTLQAEPPAGEVFVDLDELASRGSALVAAVHLALNDIVQSFGVAEALQTSEAGALRWPYWNHDRRPHVRAWADRSAVEITEDQVG